MPVRAHDTALWPILYIEVGESLQRSELPELERAVERVYERKQRFATLVDGSALRTMPDAATRKRLADWQSATRDQIARWSVLSATVVTSAIARGALTAVNWVFRPPNPQALVATVDEALEACIVALRAEHIPFDEQLTQIAARPRPRSVRHVLDGAHERSTGS